MVCEGAAGVLARVETVTDVVAFTVTVLVTVAIGATADEDDETFTVETCVDDTGRAEEKEIAGTTDSLLVLSCVQAQYTALQ